MPQRRLWRALAGALALSAACLPFDPVAAGDTAIEPPVVTVVPANDAELKRGLEGIALAVAEKDTAKLVAALDLLVQRKHQDFIPEVKKLLGSAEPPVQAAAIRAAASQEMKDVEKDVKKLLKAKQKKGAEGTMPGVVAAACIDYFDRMAVAGEEENVLNEHLKMLLADERRLKQSWAAEMCRASVHYLGRMKYKPSIPYLIDEMVADPVPANPNDPKNPPATYWEARHKLWEQSESWARWALKEMTGQEYRSVREWQAWMKQQDKKAFK